MSENLAAIELEATVAENSADLIDGREVTVSGKWLRIATVKDEELVEGAIIRNPERIQADFSKSSIKADIFTFPQKITEPNPNFPGYFEQDNMAAIALTTYEDWWNSLSQDTRRNVRKAAKQGVEIKVVQFDEQMARGIKVIYDETPIRQGRKFWHYGKDLETIIKITGTFPARSEFIGAYHQDELIAFIKMVYTDGNANIIHFLSKNASYELRPANALMAKAVEICAERKVKYLVYRKYVYGKSGESSLTEFKRRNKFEELRFPRYYIPLSIRGRLALGLKMHHGIKEMLPENVVKALRRWRGQWLEKMTRKKDIEKGQENA